MFIILILGGRCVRKENLCLRRYIDRRFGVKIEFSSVKVKIKGKMIRNKFLSYFL